MGMGTGPNGKVRVPSAECRVPLTEYTMANIDTGVKVCLAQLLVQRNGLKTKLAKYGLDKARWHSMVLDGGSHRGTHPK